MFMLWLRHASDDGGVVMPGPGAEPVRGARRVNTVLAAVRAFLKYHLSAGVLSATVLAQLYEVADDRDLPAEVRGEGAGLRYYAKARHRVREPERPVQPASDAEVLGLLRACRCARIG